MTKLAGLRKLGVSRPLALLALVAIIPLLVFGAVLTQLYAVREQSGLDKQLERAASRTAAAVSRELQAQVDLLGILAESPRLDVPLQLTSFAEIADRLRARVPVWSSIRVSDPSGRLLLTSPETENTIGTRVVDLVSHARVVETGLPTIGQMVRGPRGNAGFVVRMPVVRNGATAYVLSVLLRPTLLAASLWSTSLPPGWQSWIVDDRNQIIAATSPDVPELTPFSVVSYSPTNSEAPWAGALRIASDQLTTAPWRIVVAMPASDFVQPRNTSVTLLILSVFAAVVLAVAAIVLMKNEMKARQAQDAAIADWQRLDALSKLAGGLAHDFNNLLMGIQGGIEQLRRRRGDDERFEKVTAMMLDAVDRGKRTTQRLLGFSRRSDTGAESFRVQDRAKELLQLLKQGVRDDVVVSLEVAPDTYPVRADPRALEVALVNIASNAQDAMPKGGRLHVTVRNIEQASDFAPDLNGSYVAISAADTGIGIAPEYVNRVFDPFFTTKGPTASGLGLSQVYGFAARSGGKALASSVPGSGTMIMLLLPRSEELAMDEVRAELQPAPSALSILVVDDEPSVVEAVAGMLSGAGHSVRTAGSAAVGLELLSRFRQDLLITDITMPGMSGLDFALEARRRYPQLRVILMSGYSFQLENGIKHPFPLLSKPFSEAELLARFSDEIQRQHTMDNVIPFEEGRRG